MPVVLLFVQVISNSLSNVTIHFFLSQIPWHIVPLDMIIFTFSFLDISLLYDIAIYGSSLSSKFPSTLQPVPAASLGLGMV